MVYCSKCGFKNEEDAETCAKCGVSLKITGQARRRASRRREDGCAGREDDCFGLPHGGSIVGLIIGIAVILWGLSQVPGILPEGFEFGWIIVVVFGVLIIAGAFYKLSRR